MNLPMDMDQRLDRAQVWQVIAEAEWRARPTSDAYTALIAAWSTWLTLERLLLASIDESA